MAASVAMLVGKRAREHLSKWTVASPRPSLVFHWRRRHARRRRDLQRHHRSRDRCEGRAHEMASARLGTDQRNGRRRLSCRAMSCRTCRAFKFQWLYDPFGICLAWRRWPLSFHEAIEFLAASGSGRGFRMGCPGWLGGSPRIARIRAILALSRRGFLDHRLRYDLRGARH